MTIFDFPPIVKRGDVYEKVVGKEGIVLKISECLLVVGELLKKKVN